MFDDLYGGKNSLAWSQHLYLQEEAKKARLARQKQLAEAEEMAHYLTRNDKNNKGDINEWNNK